MSAAPRVDARLQWHSCGPSHSHHVGLPFDRARGGFPRAEWLRDGRALCSRLEFAPHIPVAALGTGLLHGAGSRRFAASLWSPPSLVPRVPRSGQVVPLAVHFRKTAGGRAAVPSLSASNRAHWHARRSMWPSPWALPRRPRVPGRCRIREAHHAARTALICSRPFSMSLACLEPSGGRAPARCAPGGSAPRRRQPSAVPGAPRCRYSRLPAHGGPDRPMVRAPYKRPILRHEQCYPRATRPPASTLANPAHSAPCAECTWHSPWTDTAEQRGGGAGTGFKRLLNCHVPSGFPGGGALQVPCHKLPSGTQGSYRGSIERVRTQWSPAPAAAPPPGLRHRCFRSPTIPRQLGTGGAWSRLEWRTRLAMRTRRQWARRIWRCPSGARSSRAPRRRRYSHWCRQSQSCWRRPRCPSWNWERA